MADPEVRLDPEILPDQPFEFYERNNICEVGFGRDVAARVLAAPGVVVAAFDDQRLVGIVRALSDGLTAHFFEFSLDLRYQGGRTAGRTDRWSRRTRPGLGRRMADRLLDELFARGCTFVEAVCVQDAEENFYASIGLRPNAGHVVYHLDRCHRSHPTRRAACWNRSSATRAPAFTPPPE